MHVSLEKAFHYIGQESSLRSSFKKIHKVESGVGGRTRGAGAEEDEDLQSSVRASDGSPGNDPRAGQGCVGWTMFVRTRHPWGSGTGRFRLGIEISGRLW